MRLFRIFTSALGKSLTAIRSVLLYTAPSWTTLKTGGVNRWCSRWSELVNDHLQRHGHAGRRRSSVDANRPRVRVLA